MCPNTLELSVGAGGGFLFFQPEFCQNTPQRCRVQEPVTVKTQTARGFGCFGTDFCLWNAKRQIYSAVVIHII